MKFCHDIWSQGYVSWINNDEQENVKNTEGEYHFQSVNQLLLVNEDLLSGTGHCSSGHWNHSEVCEELTGITLHLLYEQGNTDTRVWGQREMDRWTDGRENDRLPSGLHLPWKSEILFIKH